jgi:hypothetical protein
MSNNYEVVADKVLHFPRALPNPADVIQLLEEEVSATAGDWIPWYANRDPNNAQYGELKEFTEARLDLETQESVKQKASIFIEQFYQTVNQCIREYFRYLGLDDEVKISYFQSPQSVRPDHIAIKKYFIGEGLGPHPDWEKEDPVAFTASMYFNDDYEGGDLGFRDLSVSVKPTPGSVVVFPSSYLHYSVPMISGTKYVTNVLVLLPKSALN